MFRVRFAFLALLFLGCSHSPVIQTPDIPRLPAQQPNQLTKTLFLSKMQSPQEFEDLAQQSNGVIRQGKTIKIFIDNRSAKAPVVYFMNANYCEKSACSEPPQEAVSHYSFAKAAIKGFAMNEQEYTQLAYYTKSVEERKFFDARVQQFHMDVNGQDQEFYGIRFIERDVINNEMIQHAVTAITNVMRIPRQNVAIIVNSEDQKTDRLQSWLTSQNISVFTMEKILSGVKFVGLNPGTAYGFLRVFPPNEEDLEAYDIPVFSSLPLDLAVVAGTISTEYQDVGSHVNLKSKERGTPNMVIRDPAQIERLKSLDGKPVKVNVTYTDFSFEESTRDIVYQEYKKKLNQPWIQVPQVNETNLIHFDDMCLNHRALRCLEKSKGYGGKVAGLGFLAHSSVAGMGSPLQKKFGYRLTPMGFGIPLSNYNEFMKENLSVNPELAAAYNKLVNAELGLNGAAPLEAQDRKNTIAILKNQMLAGKIPQALYKKIYSEVLTLKSKVDAFYPGTDLNKLKIRSSSNAEDIQGFNGAGLHDSYSARVGKSTENDYAQTDCKYVQETDDDTGLTEEDIEPKTVACAIKAAYASLWNLRAVKERTYKRFDHRSASMGLSVQIAYKFRKGSAIKSNSVLVTRVLGTESVYGQQVSTQVKNGLVTNPLPDTKSELAVISFDISGKNFGINLLQYAKPVAGSPALTSMILTRPEMLQMSEIARAVEIQYCEALPNYFPGGKCASVVNSQKKALALDMEFKQYDTGQFLIKQVRNFSGK